MSLKKLLITSCIIFLGSGAYSADLIISPDLVNIKTFEDNEDMFETKVVNPVVAFNPIEFPSNEVIFKQSCFKVSSIDPILSGTYFPGGRGTNKLVVYTPKFGYHTGTNEFGTEAIVVGNTVTSLSGADSTIPINGIVISGHGTAKNWISQNVTVGSKVYVDTATNTITVYTTSDSYSYEAYKKIDEAEAIMDYYKKSSENYDDKLPKTHIQIAQNYLQIAKNQSENNLILKQYTQEAIGEANMAINTSVPYLKNELKGVWVRPTETTKEDIVATLDKLKAKFGDNHDKVSLYDEKYETLFKASFKRSNKETMQINEIQKFLLESLEAYPNVTIYQGKKMK